VQKVLGCFQERLAYSEEPMENITSEKEIIVTNYFPTGSTNPFHIRKLSHNGITKCLKITGKKDALRKCSSCYQFLSLDLFHLNGTKNASGHCYLTSRCKPCIKNRNYERGQVLKSAPPPPAKCECCSQKTDKMTHDHVRGTITLRGFLCKTCNTGMGNLGDNLKGLLQAAVYLEKDKSKIIKKLNDLE